MTQIDSVDITGMKPLDFDQLYTIYLDFKESGAYYGRKDYWDKHIVRLDKWMQELQIQVDGVKIKDK
jgi:hypothetical protein